jgi:hypothetical protein
VIDLHGPRKLSVQDKNEREQDTDLTNEDRTTKQGLLRELPNRTLRIFLRSKLDNSAKV